MVAIFISGFKEVSSSFGGKENKPKLKILRFNLNTMKMLRLNLNTQYNVPENKPAPEASEIKKILESFVFQVP
ncbi:hypothetical protein COV42_00815 [Candidatus Campbellbacteria bacterium CG11_big_fil_rev_8_21_14_0_20_44_21]|uniref:Uncharacterized protein n=1 Tax=Candidatus Campbellbacteria bacterium CG22_combo_CG10-13_8_21_14_all_43_18 TaxID=1974530 RepID=A0A2H0DX46_9BACT|nr:MAG: hypothetical protein COW82_00470 [Candidatus Campbellbacteria bacterium CG22_combo_CG10-13_8_21_14_all_43_18]PIR24447.1 MAG: hypothetical protein COV42_00815 [Candidatus Campbellbacteria bacterium CG11_big_fil_rev_8_21_14_0_20_44_21]